MQIHDRERCSTGAEPGGSPRLTAAMCLALVLVLSGSLSFQSLIPALIGEWRLDHAAAGWLASVSYIAYALAAPFLVGMTDRVDARRVFIAAALVLALAAAGFALFAQGFWSALPWRALTGIGVAGSYMPGLKALSDRSGVGKGRPQSFYTASYALGSALSLGMTGVLADLLGWRSALLLIAAVSLAGACVVFAALTPRRPPASRGRRLAGALLQVLHDRDSMRYVFAYTFHTFELFAFRTWIVALLAFALAGPGSEGLAAPAALATAFLLLGLPASILGNELAARIRRERALLLVMLASAAGALLLALSVGLSPLLLLAAAALYAVLVTADAAAIMVGTLAAAPPERRGATIAVQTLLAAVAAMASPLVFGYILDRFGGGTAQAWRMGFMALAAVALAGALMLIGMARQRKA